MYYELFNKITEVIKTLEDAQKKAEEMYVMAGEGE